ncbi:hypothetical protein HKX48_000380 [Thoreauomyces humboldtii]|nr:hypothetical protein HKX48_000380 [Thoreauomyces humboldtii]
MLASSFAAALLVASSVAAAPMTSASIPLSSLSILTNTVSRVSEIAVERASTAVVEERFANCNAATKCPFKCIKYMDDSQKDKSWHQTCQSGQVNAYCNQKSDCQGNLWCKYQVVQEVDEPQMIDPKTGKLVGPGGNHVIQWSSVGHCSK